MFTPEYSHDLNRELHTVDGAAESLRVLFPDGLPETVLDIGCGTGTWLHAAQDRGVKDIAGVDGLYLTSEKLFIPKELIRHEDLNLPFDLGRRVDLLFSFETAEHIEPENADVFVDTLVRHSDTILFSAAAPRQPGTHHVNCQWPVYWQEKFNARGYRCDDAPRWKIWDNASIEPWYRQNMMMAVRDPERAGKEERIRSVVHPELMENVASTFLGDHARLIEQGAMRWPWYLTAPLKAAMAKARYKVATVEK